GISTQIERRSAGASLVSTPSTTVQRDIASESDAARQSLSRFPWSAERGTSTARAQLPEGFDEREHSSNGAPPGGKPNTWTLRNQVAAAHECRESVLDDREPAKVIVEFGLEAASTIAVEQNHRLD